MAQWIGFTNQKLYQCQLLLTEREKAAGNPVLSSALESGALHLLHDAWLSYLQELGEMVKFREPVLSLADLLSRSPLVTGEMRELEHLAENGFSWVAQFLAAVADLNRQAVVKTQAPAADNLLISTRDESDSQIPFWWRSLSAIIDNQRENRQES